VSNIHFVRHGAVVTPGLASGLLNGITRRLLIEKVGPAAGVEISETALKPADLGGMQECFLTSTTRDVVPVAAIDAQHFDVSADSVTRRLKAAFADYVRAYAQAHPEWRVLP
jgi:branched-chain amino acid aminotransferase